MGGDFNIEKKEQDHGLDHIQYGDWGCLKERYKKNGDLLDIAFRPSNELARKEGIERDHFNLSGVGEPSLSGK